MNDKSNRQRRRTASAAPMATPQRQQGAAAVFLIAAIIAALTAMALSFNIGMLYFAQRELQKEATLAAMAGVQVGGGCLNAGKPGSLTNVQAAVQQAIQNNGNYSPAGALALMTGINGSAAVEVGRTVDTTGKHVFQPLTAGDSRIDSVRVNLTRPSPSIFGAGLLPGARTVVIQASATARQQPLGGFHIGTTLASLNTSNSPLLNPLLTALLGTSINLKAVDYTNMAGVQLSLANLMVAAGVNDLNSLLALNTNIAGVKQILAAATGTVNPSVAQLVQGIGLGNAQANTNIALADLLGNLGNGLNPTVTDAASLAPSLDLLDLLTQLGEAAAAKNPNNFLQLNFGPSVPGLFNLQIFLSVQQPMQSGFGPVGATAQTAQITLRVRANIDTALLNGIFALLKTLTLGITNFSVDPINIGLDLLVGNATGTLDSLTCPTDAKPAPTATVGVNTHVATLQKLGTFVGAPSSNPDIVAGNLLNITTNTGLLGLDLLDLTVAIKTLPGALNVGNSTGAEAGPFSIYDMPTQPVTTTQPHVYNYIACNSLGSPANHCASQVDPNNPYQAIPSGNLLGGISTYIGNLVAKNNLTIVIKLLNIPIDLSAILDPLVALINTLVLTPLTSLLDQLLNPLLALLGVQLGSGTVLMDNVVIGTPTLVTTALPGS